MKIKNKIKNVGFFSLLCFVYLLFEKQFVQLFDAYVLPLLSVMEFSRQTNILFGILLLYPAYLICKCFKNNYFVPYPTFSLLLFVSLLYIRYRFFGVHTTFPTLIGVFGHSDVLAIMLGAFLMSCLMAYIPYRKNIVAFLNRLMAYLCRKKEADKKKPNSLYILDSPITSKGEDLLNFSGRAEELAKQLVIIPAENSCSIGIIGSWGMGKTSFLNLLEEKLKENKDDFIIVKINPRHSFTAKNIQEDFFEELFSTLKKYDSRFSTNFKNYLKAIDILNENKIISFLFNIQKLWDKESEKSKINEAIERLNKRIVVIIEDLDRLLAKEIIEVFKLIDGNASFKNLIFITAYDKNHINKIIGKAYSNEHSLFSDKFFTIEIFLPLNPYDMVYKYLSAELFKNDCFDKADKSKSELKKILKKHTDLLEKYLPTFREVKRFLNLFVFPYSEVPEEVEFEDFFLLYLIKYKYPEEYLSIYNDGFKTIRMKKTITYMSPTEEILVNEKYILTEDVSNLKSKDVMELLFNRPINSNASINYQAAFYTYFYEDIHNGLSRKEVKEHLFNDDFEVACEYINQYISDPKLKDIIDVLYDKDYNSIKSKEEFERYLAVLFYIQSKKTEVDQLFIHHKIKQLVHKDNLAILKEIYGYEEDEYKTLLSKKITGSYPNYPYQFTRKMINFIIHKKYLEKEMLFTQSDFLKMSLIALKDCIEKEPQISQKHLNLLYSCTDKIQHDDVKLSQKACRLVKELIEESPSSYFDLFVSWRENMSAFHCERFYDQIFGSNEEFESFIEQQTKDSVPNIDLIKNFWKLFKNNDHNNRHGLMLQGNWQDIIKNNLEEDIKHLDQLQDIERRLEKLEKLEKLDENHKKQALELLEELEKIPLYICLRYAIEERINNLKP